VTSNAETPFLFSQDKSKAFATLWKITKLKRKKFGDVVVVTLSETTYLLIKSLSFLIMMILNKN